MYNEQIENLIKHAIADGEITEAEKSVLLKRASEAGIDLDEFNMVLDARLFEQKQKNNQSAPPSSPTITEPVIDTEDKPGIGWQILALLFPIAGLIMYFNNKDKYPKKANSYATMAAIGFVVNLIL